MPMALSPLRRRGPNQLKPKPLELGWCQRDARDGVEPAPSQSLPGPFDLRGRNTGPPQEVGEPVEPPAPGLRCPALNSLRDDVNSRPRLSRECVCVLGDGTRNDEVH